MPEELFDTITLYGFHFDPPNVQDSFDMALSWAVLQMGYIGQHRRVY